MTNRAFRARTPRPIVPLHAKTAHPRLSQEEREWVIAQKEHLTPVETQRMFFRKFGRNLANGTVPYIWKEGS